MIDNVVLENVAAKARKAVALQFERANEAERMSEAFRQEVAGRPAEERQQLLDHFTNAWNEALALQSFHQKNLLHIGGWCIAYGESDNPEAIKIPPQFILTDDERREILHAAEQGRQAGLQGMEEAERRMWVFIGQIQKTETRLNTGTLGRCFLEASCGAMRRLKRSPSQ